MNVAIYITRSARFFGDRTAIFDSKRDVSFRALEDRTNRLAHGLVSLGIRHRDRVVIVLPNSAEWIEADFAVAKAGAVSVPITAHLHEHEIASMTAAVEPSLLITSSDLLPRLQPMIDELKLPTLLVGAPGEDGYEGLIARSSDAHICAEVDEALDGKLIRFTSGTTGSPKGVYLTHRNWLSTAHCMLLDRCSLRADDTYLGTSPFVHAGGLWILPSLIRGTAIQVMDKFDPERVLDLIDHGRCTVLQLVPTGLRRLLDSPKADALKSKSLRAVSYGGAPIDSVTLQEATALMGPKLIQGYGLNEAPMVSTLQQHEHHHAMPEGMDWQQPLGREVTEAEVIVADKDGKPVPDGEVGEIAVRGPMVFLEYWRNPEATAQSMRNGFFHTGDLGLRGAHGILYLAGRSKDIIVTGGYNVSPPEVEAVLIKHPDVQQCVVVGLPDREWGEQVTAFVVAKSGSQTTEDALIDYCRKHLTSYKKPKSVRFVPSLPLNSNGKVVRRLLRDQAIAAEAAS